MIRVLHVVGQMNPGGVETLLMNVYRHIDRSKVQFDFVVHSTEPGYFDEEIRSLGARIFILPDPKQVPLPRYASQLRRLLRQEGPFGAVHSHVHSFTGYVLSIARWAGIPVRLAHSHNTGDGKPDTYARRFYRRLMQMLIRRNATHMLACSRPAALALYGQTAADDPRVSILPNAIDLTPYRYLPSNKEDLRRELSLPAGTTLIGHVGSFRPQKNHTFLIELMAAVIERMPAGQLILVGDGPLKGHIELQVQEKGIGDHVHFLGLRGDVPRILGALDLFLFPSLYEGLGIVLIEAQAAGLPCVTSDTIPRDADLGLGLIKSAQLAAGTEHWTGLISDQLALPYIPWKEREAALSEAGYDVNTLAPRLLRIYTNG